MKIYLPVTTGNDDTKVRADLGEYDGGWSSHPTRSSQHQNPRVQGLVREASPVPGLFFGTSTAHWQQNLALQQMQWSPRHNYQCLSSPALSLSLPLPLVLALPIATVLSRYQFIVDAYVAPSDSVTWHRRGLCLKRWQILVVRLEPLINVNSRTGVKRLIC